MKYLFLILFIVLQLQVYSQDLRITLIGESHISWMVPDKKDIKREGAIAVFNAGLGMDIFFANHYAFSTGLFLGDLGGRISYGDTITYNRAAIRPGSTIRYKIQYIGIPFGIKLKTDEIGYATYFANAGFNPMIRLKATGTDVSGQEYFFKLK